MNNKGMEKYLMSQDLYNLGNKKKNINDIMRYMLIRTQSMFVWHGLPDTIPEKYLEEYLQINGFAGIARANDDNLYALEGGLGGVPDAYYNPTILTVANPYLKFNRELRIDKECVVIRNDIFYMGLIPMLNKYASQLAENELSMYMASINTRVQSILSAGDDATKESCQKFIDDLIKGKLSVIGDNAFLQSLKALSLTTSTTNILGNLIEMEQYLKASLYNELGLNANYNMKREALNSAESSINDDILFPLVDEMLKARKEGAEAINNMFGLDVSVELSSSWRDNKEEETATIESITGTGDSEHETGEEAEESEEEAEESEEEAEESEEEAEESEESEESEKDIKEDIEDIKDDIEDIKDELDVTKDESEVKEND